MLHTLEPISELREITENLKTELPNSSRTDVVDQRKPRNVNKSIALRARDSRESSKAHTENTLNLNNSAQGISQRSWRSMKSREFLSKSIDPGTKQHNKSMRTKREEIGDLEMVQQLTETFGTIRKNNQRVIVNFERNRYDFEPTTNPSQRSQKEEISLEKTLSKYQLAKQFFETQKKIEFEKSFEEEIPVEEEQPKEDHDEVERKFYLPVISFKYEKYSERKTKKKIPEKKPSRQPTPSYARAKSSRSPVHHKEESPVAETRRTPFGAAVAAAETLNGNNLNNTSLIKLKPMPTQEGQVSDKKMATAPVAYKSPAVKYQEFIDNMKNNISTDTIHQKLSEKVRRAQNDIIKKGNFGAYNERTLRAEFDKILSGLGGRNKTIRKGNVIEELRKESSAMPPSYKLY